MSIEVYHIAYPFSAQPALLDNDAPDNWNQILVSLVDAILHLT